MAGQSRRAPGAVIGFGLTLLVLVVGGVLGWANVEWLANYEGMVTHTHEVIGTLEALLATLTDAETGQRGFLLTGEAKYLAPYTDALRRVQAIMADLEKLTADNHEQQAQLAVLAPKIAARLDEMKRTIALAQRGNRAAAMKIVRAGTGRAMMDELRGGVAGMRHVEEDLLRQRAAESAASLRTTIWSIVLTAVIGIVLLCLVFYLSRRNLIIQERAARRLAEERERLRTTLASIGDAVMVTDMAGRVTKMNAVAEALTGWKREDAIGQPLATVFRIVNEETRRPVTNPAMRAIQEGVVVGLANHTVLIARDGKERPIDDSAAPIRCQQGEVVGCVLVFRDVTERRHTERQIRDSEARHRQLAEALQLADRRKDVFLATLAHELRNPLAAIHNGIELLRRAEGQPDIARTAHQMIQRQLTLVVRLIDDLLDISRIGRGKLQMRKERVALAAVLQSAVETARPSIEAQGHALTVMLPPEAVVLDADPPRLAQVFLNLLLNAAKYTEKGGRIALTAERDGGTVKVSVGDTGIGIAAEHLPRLFEMFAQVDSARVRAQGGLGIGLALVRGLVELHGGSVEARSPGPGLGSEFVVRLPIAEQAPAALTSGQSGSD